MLGTDSSINNDSNNILAEAHFAGLMYKGSERDASFLTSEQLFRMITENARVLDSRIGRIEKGFYADINVFDPNEYAWNPSYNFVRNLIFNGVNIRPIHVLVRGKWVVKNYKLRLSPHPLLKKYKIFDEYSLYRKIGQIVK